MFSFRRILPLALVAFLFPACGGDADCLEAGDPACKSGAAEVEREPPRPLALRLEVVEGEFKVGTEVQVRALFEMDDGTELPVTEGLAFESSREDVATIDETGLIEVVAGGEAQIRATGSHELLEEPLVGELEISASCDYPAYSDGIGQGKTLPPLAWPAKKRDGTSFEFRLADVHCHADWKWAKTIHIAFTAAWCGPCTDYVRGLTSKASKLREFGMEVVILELETQQRTLASTDFAYLHVKSITNGMVPGIVAGDLQSMHEGTGAEGGIIRSTGFVKVWPTRIVLRTRDMKVIADASSTGPWSGRQLPLENIASAPEMDWRPKGNVPPF